MKPNVYNVLSNVQYTFKHIPHHASLEQLVIVVLFLLPANKWNQILLLELILLTSTDEFKVYYHTWRPRVKTLHHQYDYLYFPQGNSENWSLFSQILTCTSNSIDCWEGDLIIHTSIYVLLVIVDYGVCAVTSWNFSKQSIISLNPHQSDCTLFECQQKKYSLRIILSTLLAKPFKNKTTG